MNLSWESSVIMQTLILFFTVLITALGALIKLSINRVIATAEALDKKHESSRHDVDDKLESINKHLSEMNGAVRESKVWQRMHECKDDERHNDNARRLSAIEIALSRREL